jgi:cytosine deaminase
VADLLIRNVRPMGEAAGDVLVRDGRIHTLAANLAATPGAAIEDGQGALLLPGLIEAHTHIDKTLWGMPWYVNEVGPNLTDRIDNERRWRAESGTMPGRNRWPCRAPSWPTARRAFALMSISTRTPA